MGSVSLLAFLLAGRLVRREPPIPLGGVAIAAATLLAWSLGEEHSTTAWLGVLTVMALTGIVAVAGGRASVVALAAVPGAAILAMAAPAEPWWFRMTVFVAVPVGGFLVDEFDVRYERLGLGMLFYGLACLGAFLAVPDTELPRALLAVVFPMMFLAWPKVQVRLGRTGAYGAMSVFTLSTVTGGVGRSASVIGAMACLGLMVLEPMVVSVRHRLARLPYWLHETPEAAVLATIPQVVLVLVASRVAGLMVSITGAMVTVLVLVTVFTPLLVWVERTRIPVDVDDRG